MSCCECLRRWRQWVQPLAMVVYCLLLLAAIPVLVNIFLQKGYSAADQGPIVGGVFVLMALPISLWDITQHVAHESAPYLQRHVVRILWMVPIYAMNAWISLVLPAASVYLDSLRECYEAYVIYNFMRFLLNFLEHQQPPPEMALRDKTQVRHIFPLCFLAAQENGPDLQHACKHGILQYVVVRPASTLVAFCCQQAGVLGEGEFSFSVAFPYLLLVNNISQFAAMYCLVLFYRANKVRLRPMRPLPKFLCIKAVVFFSFFQQVIVALLVRLGVLDAIIPPADKQGTKEASASIQNFLICVEMFWAAVGHHLAFPLDELSGEGQPGVGVEREPRSFCSSLLSMCDVSDVQSDLNEHLGVVSSSLSRRIRRPNPYQRIPSDERTPLTSDSSDAVVEQPAPAYYHSLA